MQGMRPHLLAKFGQIWLKILKIGYLDTIRKNLDKFTQNFNNNAYVC